MKTSTHIALLLILFMLLLLAVDAAAQVPGDLLVTPTRALFENGKRNETLTLINRGSDTATYRISVIQYRMTTDGELQRIDTPDSAQLFAGEMIRFFPREVTIAPGESQNVRVQLRIPDSLADGEYRSHLYFRGVPKVEPLAATTDTATSEFAVKLSAVYGLSVPMIIRRGKLQATVSLADLSLKPGDSTHKPVLSMKFTRSGSSSAFGTVKVTFVPNSGESRIVASMGGVAIYTPNSERRFRLPLTLPADLKLGEGKLMVEYLDASETNPQTITSAEMTLNGTQTSERSERGR